MLRSLKMVLAAVIAVLLVACGGGSSVDDGGTASSDSGTGSTTRLLPSFWSSEGRSVGGLCFQLPECSGNPYAPFSARAWVAPADGATVKGIVRLEVRGNLMQRVELLPASGYEPRLGVFKITNDKAFAWMDFDTTQLPNGPLKVRISAFGTPPEQSEVREIVAMSELTWNIDNSPKPVSVLTATVTSAPVTNATVSGIVHLEIKGSGIVNAELLPASGYKPRLGVFNVSADRTRAWLDFDTRSLPDGAQDVRVSAFNVTEGQPGAMEVIAMPPRQWNVVNGNTGASPFTAALTISPVNGEILRGTIRLEMRGTGIKYVELQSANGQKIAGFSEKSRGLASSPNSDSYFSASLDFRTVILPNGLQDVRIVAYDAPEGTANAREIVLMASRQWDVRN